jgi:hypothetical protein
LDTCTQLTFFIESIKSFLCLDADIIPNIFADILDLVFDPLSHVGEAIEDSTNILSLLLERFKLRGPWTQNRLQLAGHCVLGRLEIVCKKGSDQVYITRSNKTRGQGLREVNVDSGIDLWV